MIPSVLFNLIVSIVAVATVLRVAYLVAGGRLEQTADTTQLDTPYELERAA